jgi:hypothetical protein
MAKEKSALEEYRELSKQLQEVMDELDDVWDEMTPDEKAAWQKENGGLEAMPEATNEASGEVNGNPQPVKSSEGMEAPSAG